VPVRVNSWLIFSIFASRTQRHKDLIIFKLALWLRAFVATIEAVKWLCPPDAGCYGIGQWLEGLRAVLRSSLFSSAFACLFKNDIEQLSQFRVFVLLWLVSAGVAAGPPHPESRPKMAGKRLLSQLFIIN
jgi:hypothetical protein